MKHFSLLFLSLILLGAGCPSLFGGNTSSQKRDGAVYTSQDAGATWRQQTAYPTATGVGNIGAFDISAMAMDPSDHLALYIGTPDKGLLFSTDGGVTWQNPRTEALRQGHVRDIAVDPGDMCTIYATQGVRLYRSENCGRTFESVYHETRENMGPVRVAVSTQHPEEVYLGLSNGDVLKSFNRGRDWKNILVGRAALTDLLVNRLDSRSILVAFENGLRKSDDAGLTWRDVTESIAEFPGGDELFELVEDQTGNFLLASTRYGMLRSVNRGESWEAVSMVTTPGQVRVRALAVHTEQNSAFIAYATSDTFYTSRDGGVTWTSRRLPTTRAASALRIDPTNPSVIYLGVRTP